MKNTYKLTSDRLDGHLLATYSDGYLHHFELVLNTPMDEFRFNAFVRLTPYREDPHKFKELGLGVELLQELAPNKKIALFCTMYEKYKGIKYKATARDGGMIKTIQVKEELLKHYFESESFNFKGKHSINNLVRYYNELLQEIAAKGKDSFPNHWSKEFENKLDTVKMREYWAHLRRMGLKPIKDAVGNVKDWK